MAKKKLPKVLIVEDDKFVLKAMDYKFKESGFEVKLAPTAEIGLSVLENWLPDAIVLDILLPGIDGYAFLRTVRGNDKWKSIPVIISSNLDEEIGNDESANDYIVKSDLDLDELVKKVRSHIK